MPTVNIK